jgi:hypothetical protein
LNTAEHSHHRRLSLVLVTILAASMIALLPAETSAQLQHTDASRNWGDRPVGGDNRRHVKVCIDPEPVAGYEQAVRDAIAAWNAAQNFPGGIQLDEDCTDPDIKIKWNNNPNAPQWATTSPRDGGNGARTITINYSYDDGAGGTQNLNAQQVENVARHELGHGEGLRDDAAADAGTMRRKASTAGLDGADWGINNREIASKKSLYEITPAVPPGDITSNASILEFGEFLYYLYEYHNGGPISLDELGMHFPFTTPANFNHSFPPGWNPNYAESGFGIPGPATTTGKAHPSEGVFYIQASPGNELAPGATMQVALASTTGPSLGSAYALDSLSKTVSSFSSVPVPGQHYYFAEGAAVDGVFETWILLSNPSTVNDAQALVSFHTSTTTSAQQLVNLPPSSRVSLKANDFVQSYDVSTEVSVLDGWVSAEGSIYGLTAEHLGAATFVPAQAPSETWFLTEGAADGPYETWVLVYNPMDIPVNTYLTFLTDTGPRRGPQVEIPSKQRRTFRVNSEIGAPTYHASTMVLADHPIVAQRTTFIQNPPGSSLGGAATSSPGIPEPQTNWFVAEGATIDFNTWILLANPSPDTSASVGLEFLTSSGSPVATSVAVPPQGRVSVLANAFVSSYDVSTRITSDIPILAERAQYGTGGAFPGSAHSSEATTRQDTAWILPEGATAGPFRYYVLVSNTNSQPAQIHLHFNTSAGEMHGPTVSVPANSRMTFAVDDLVPDDFAVMTRVESSLPIAVDHALYTTGSFTGDGTSSPGTPLFGQKRFLT